jgi:hypothetical protein
MKSIVNSILFQFLIFSTICCQNPDKKSDELANSDTLEKSENPMQIDTLLAEKYFWQSFVVSENEFYFIKESNSLYEYNLIKQKVIGKIPCNFMCEIFSVTDGFLAFDVELEQGRTILIYKLNNLSKWDSLVNYHIVNQLYNDDILVLAKPIDTHREQDSVLFYDIRNKNFKLKTKKFEYSIVAEDAIFLYDRNIKTKNSTKYFEITKIDRRNFTKASFDLKIKDDIEIIYIYNDRYLAKIDNELIMYNFDGIVIDSWTIFNKDYYDIFCTKDRILIYNWLNTDDETLDKYYFVRQTIDLLK